MTALQFNAIEPTFSTVLCNGDVASNDVVNIALSDCFRYFAKEWVGNCTRCPHRQTAVHAAGLAAVVVDLRKNRCAVLVHRRCDVAVTRYDVAVEAVDEFFVWPVGGMR